MINLILLSKGIAVGASLISAIGPQNAFVLKQGLLKQHRLLTASVCILVDTLLIALGVGGFGHLITHYPLLLASAKWLGAAFLAYYGAHSFNAAFKKKTIDLETVKNASTIKRTLLTLLALSLLNPHVYLDTVVLIGSIGAQQPPLDRPIFALGAISVSFIWFLGLSYGSGMLSPLFKNPRAWKVLDFIIGIMMWSIALALVLKV